MDFDYTLETITPNVGTELSISTTGAFQLPSGTTAQQPGAAVAGALRWNTTLTRFEYYNGTVWATFGAGTVTSVSGAGGTTGLTLTGGPITTTGTLTLGGTLAIANGGTGQVTAPTAFNALSPMTTIGDIVYQSASTVASRLAVGTTGQVLTVTSGLPSWTTVGAASFSVNVGPSGTIAWVLVSGNTYSAVITHNLGTQNVVVQMADIANNQIVVPDLITVTSSTQVTVQVNANTRTLRVVIIANGASIAAGASTPSSIIVENNGVALPGTFTTINVIGALSATAAGSVATVQSAVTAIRNFTYVATSFDSPNNADWTVNALAPAIADPINNAISVRQFINTAPTGVGFTFLIPTTASNITFTYQGRSQTAAAGTLQFEAFLRTIINSVTPGAPSAWSAALPLTSQTIAANTNYISYTTSVSVTGAGLVVGNTYQVEFVRNTAVAGNLAQPWLLQNLTVAFT